jgi:hypothetical protein
MPGYVFQQETLQGQAIAARSEWRG